MINKKKTLRWGMALFACLAFLEIRAQEDVSHAFTNQEQEALINSVAQLLDENYIFPETAKKVGMALKENLRKGIYTPLRDPAELAGKITEDLRSLSKDLHFSLQYNPGWVVENQVTVSKEDSIAFAQQRLAAAKRRNFGFKQLTVLEGNVGYLNLSGFEDTRYAGETAATAMNFFENADALIIDLRQNGGGSPSMIQLITSYLFDAEPIHLNSFYWRQTDQTTQTWTLPYVPGKRRPDLDVYVLTSKYTFSAAEEFTYNLKNLERATIVGETTGGGAHPVDRVAASDKFVLQVPIGRAINPITNTNWEGTGVVPDINVPSDKALLTAHIKALENLKREHADVALTYDWHLPALRAKEQPISVAKKTLEAYVGKYGPRKITLENGKLFYQREEGPKYKLNPMSDVLFSIEEIPYFRVHFLKSEAGKTQALQGIYENGRTDKHAKSG
ncbi:S41 family peptidase [Flavobacteriaceae bacterium 3-367]|uniref:S41 family peptidase n=1 Tax=Eudoraea algarum TaxID=3417568 RepID=UPI003291DC69